MVFQFEKKAFNGEPMPDGLSLPDQCAYRFLSSLYRDIRAGAITKDQAAVEKGKMTYQYSIVVGLFQNWREMGEKWTQHYKNMEGAANRYAKERSLENADRLYQAVYGVPVPKEVVP